MKLRHFKTRDGHRILADAARLEEFAHYLPDPGKVVFDEPRQLKKGGSRSIVRTPEGFLLKRYAPRSPWRTLINSIITSPALNGFRAQRALFRAGFSTPAPLAAIVVRGRYLNVTYREAWLLTDYVDETTNFRDVMHANIELFSSNHPRRLDFLRSAANLIADLHRQGYFHQDLHSRNLLLPDVDPMTPGAERFLMIDFDGSVDIGKFPYILFLYFRFLDLRRFLLTMGFWIRRTDRERFLRAYFEAAGDSYRIVRLFHQFWRICGLVTAQKRKKARRDLKAALTLGLEEERAMLRRRHGRHGRKALDGLEGFEGDAGATPSPAPGSD